MHDSVTPALHHALWAGSAVQVNSEADSYSLDKRRMQAQASLIQVTACLSTHETFEAIWKQEPNFKFSDLGGTM
jgi:hypothetical protein